MENKYEQKFDLENYEKLANEGNLDALLKVADYYCNLCIDIRIENNHEENDESMMYAKLATEYFEKAANQGNAEAQYQYAKRLNSSFECNEVQFKYYNLAAEQGHVQALNELGLLYEYGNFVEEDFEKALEYYNKAIKLETYYPSYYFVESIYEKKFEREQLVEKEFLENSSIEYLLNKAYCYMFGVHVEEDVEKAFELYNKAHKRGSIEGTLYVGLQYLNESEDAEKKKKGFDLIKSAADTGHAIAQYNYAYCIAMYYNNYEEAFKYYKLSADQGNPQAMFKLSYLYKMGLGVEKNFQSYIKYLKLANDFGVNDVL